MVKKERIFSVILFYWYHGKLSKPFRGNIGFFLSLYFDFGLMLFGFIQYSLANEHDGFYLLYGWVGLILSLIMLICAFIPARNAHKALLENIAPSIHEFYVRRGF